MLVNTEKCYLVVRGLVAVELCKDKTTADNKVALLEEQYVYPPESDLCCYCFAVAPGWLVVDLERNLVRLVSNPYWEVALPHWLRVGERCSSAS